MKKLARVFEIEIGLNPVETARGDLLWLRLSTLRSASGPSNNSGASIEECNACLAAGMDQFMGKPFQESQLVDALERCATRRATAQAKSNTTSI